MSCGCNKTTLQGKKYCQDCMPDEYHWLVPVSKEPDPFLMDRHHAYIMPNNTIYVLSHDRTQAIDISGNDIDLTPYALKTELANKITELNQKLTTGLEGAKYYEGEGIRIDEDKRIHSTVNLTEVNERLDAIEQAGNSPYKAGTGIEITPDLTINNTVSTDALETRVQALEEKEDQNTTYTAGTGLQLSGTEFSVDPNDLPGLDQIDDLRDKVTALEGKADADTKYTAGTGLILSGTKFSIDDTILATKEELNHTNTRLTAEETATANNKISAVKGKTFTDVNARFEELETQSIALDAKKANNVQEAWIKPTLINEWTTGDNALFAPIQYKKDNFGFVHLRGGIANGVNRTICTLPVGYRPEGNVPIIAKKQWSHTSFDWLSLNENGILSISNTSMPTDTRLYFYAIFLAEN